MKTIITPSTRGIPKINQPSRMTALASSLVAIAALTAVSCRPTTPCDCNGKTQPKGLPVADMRPLYDQWNPSKKEKYNAERPARFAIYSYPYAIASTKAYAFEPADAFIPFPEEEQWKTCDGEKCHYTEDEIGFAAKTWLRTKSDGSKELVIAFRGTQFEEKADWKYANFVPISQACCHNQYKAALFYAKSAVSAAEADRSGMPVILTGHSLGGGLAEYCQRFIQNSEAITFDPSPNQGVLYSWGRRETKKDTVRVYERGEILSYFRRFGSPDIKLECTPEGKGVRAVWMDFYRRNPVASHRIHDLTMNLIKVSVLHGDKGAISVYDQMDQDLRDGKIRSLP